MTDRITASITLPWPDKRLNPNARVHWADLAKAKKAARNAAAWEARIQGAHIIKGKAGRVRATITFSPPDRRARDLDNCIAAMKAAIDGIADVIGVDDSKWTFTATMGEPVKGGRVRLDIEAVG
jgi:crossover junction endodeoxyribonuclease RusA